MGPPADSPYSSGWDQQALAAQFQTLHLQQPPQHEWYFDTGATNHVASDASTLSSISPSFTSSTPNIIVSDGTRVPVTSTGSTQLPHNLHLNNVLVAPNLIKNLIFVRQFTIDNNCSVEFDPIGARSSGVTVQGHFTLYYPRPLLSLQLLPPRFGINDSATQDMKPSPSLLTLLPSSAHQGPPTVFAMLANLVAMFAFPFPPPLPILVMCFSY
jgi:hypothetical protein